jgi:maltooligosyltrehalose synthase
MTDFRVPIATYRIQFSRDFTFEACRELIPYLHDLGITELYASLLFQARLGSLHGYSVTNPMEINREIGSRSSFDKAEILEAPHTSETGNLPLNRVFSRFPVALLSSN